MTTPPLPLLESRISLAQQKKYLAENPAEEIELAIERANEYAADQEKGNESNPGRLVSDCDFPGWGAEHKAKLEVRQRSSKKQVASKRKSVESNGTGIR